MELILKYFTELTERQRAQFAALAGLYGEWNAKINVISRQDIGALYPKHVLHSLAIAAVAAFRPGARVVDVGTGGGFPGVPLAIAFPEARFWLVDSIAKKIKVVQAVVDALELKNVTVVHGRVEALPVRRGDCVVARAVAPLGELWAWCRPLLQPGTSAGDFANGLLCLKGGDLQAEIAASGLRPHVIPVRDLFPEPQFADKYLLHVPR